MIAEVGDIGWLGRMAEKTLKNGSKQTRELLGIRAKVKFPWRSESIVQVILERKRVFTNTGMSERVCFYSVYEARRDASK